MHKLHFLVQNNGTETHTINITNEEKKNYDDDDENNTGWTNGEEIEKEMRKQIFKGKGQNGKKCPATTKRRKKFNMISMNPHRTLYLKKKIVEHEDKKRRL